MDTYGQINSDLTNIAAQVELWKQYKDSQKADERYQKEYEDARSDAEYAKEVSERNLALQKEAFDYQKELNKTTMEREDTAHQRELQDYLNMGFSPLAVLGGSGSSSTSLQSGSAPQKDVSAYMSSKDRKRAIAQNRAENLIRQHQLRNDLLKTSLQSIQLKNSIYDAKMQRSLQARGLSATEYKNYLDSQNLDINRVQALSNITRNNSLNMLDKAQAERLRSQNALDAEYILSQQQEREWMASHGYRNIGLENYILSLVDKNVDENTFYEDLKQQFDDYMKGSGSHAFEVKNYEDMGSVDKAFFNSVGNGVRRYYVHKYGSDAYDYAMKKIGKSGFDFTWQDFKDFRKYIQNYKK